MNIINFGGFGFKNFNTKLVAKEINSEQDVEIFQEPISPFRVLHNGSGCSIRSST